MSLDLPVKDLMNYLPHRPPMIWVNRVVEVGQDYKGLTGKCRIQLNKGALYINNGKELRGSSAVEFTAQAFGYLKAAYQVIYKIKNLPRETYLTGIRSCEANFEGLDLSSVQELEVRISVLREMLPVTYIRGEITLVGSDETLAVAEIQVYVD